MKITCVTCSPCEGFEQYRDETKTQSPVKFPSNGLNIFIQQSGKFNLFPRAFSALSAEKAWERVWAS